MSQPGINKTTFRLNNGHQIPAIGLGTWQGQKGSDDEAQLKASIIFALQTGYRLIDTAQYYGVEPVVGAAIRESGIPRSEITVVTKFPETAHHDPATTLQKSLDLLDIGYIDIFLMHWPVAQSVEGRNLGISESPTFVETYKMMEPLVGEKCRGIGVSNFTQKTLETLLSETTVVPLVNQVELHALNPNLKLVPWCRERGIHAMSWSTLGGELLGHKNQILSHSLFQTIAKNYSVSVGVVSLSWAVQRGITVIPKSSKESRIAENLKTVTLTDDEMSSMNEAHNTVGKLRLMDHMGHIGGKADDGTKTIMGWSIVDFGLEDKDGQWLS